ncbi:MAG: hypothetical protein WC393_03215 [Candidatus Nanoarchaeia archaeon]|jgi:hypothetical protein
MHRFPTKEMYLEWYKIIYLENNLELFKKTSEYYLNEDKNKGMPKFSYKYYTKKEGSTQRYRYHEFFSIINTLYKIYAKVKEAKTFEELLQKLESLTFLDIDKNISIKLNEKYFKKNKLKEDWHSLIRLFLISKWLNLAPNKEYEPYFKKARKLVESAEFSGQFN